MENIYESFSPNFLGIKIINKLEVIALDHIIACTPTAAWIKSTVDKDIAKKLHQSYTVFKVLDDFIISKKILLKLQFLTPN